MQEPKPHSSYSGPYIRSLEAALLLRTRSLQRASVLLNKNSRDSGLRGCPLNFSWMLRTLLLVTLRRVRPLQTADAQEGTAVIDCSGVRVSCSACNLGVQSLPEPQKPRFERTFKTSELLYKDTRKFSGFRIQDRCFEMPQHKPLERQTSPLSSSALLKRQVLYRLFQSVVTVFSDVYGVYTVLF